MTEFDDDLEQVLRPWMRRHAPAAPSELVLRIYGEIETMPEQASQGRLSRFTAWPVAAWTAAVAAVAIVAVAGAVFFATFSGLPGVGNQPTPVASPSPSDPTAVVDGLIAAWNAGDGQQAAALYAPEPAVRLMIDSGAVTASPASPADVASTVTDWHATGTRLTRTGDVLTQGLYAAATVTWTSSDGSFNGVEVIRLAPDGRIAEQYLIGASAATATGTAAGAAVVNAVNGCMKPIAALLGAAEAASFAPDAEARQFEGSQASGTAIGSAEIAGALGSSVNQPCTANVGPVLTQGPFAAYPASNPVATGGTNAGFTVLELNGNGLIQYSWGIRDQLLGSSPTPPPSDPKAVADSLIAAWNAGDGHQASTLYDPSVKAWFMIDSGSATDMADGVPQLLTRLTDMHANNFVLTRSGASVLTAGPYTAYPVTWTLSGAPYDGVEVLRLSADNLVSEQYLIGTSSAASGSASPADATTLINAMRDAQNGSDGQAFTALLAATAQGWVYRDGAQDSGPVGPAGFATGIENGDACCQTNTGPALTQGSFIVHTTTLTNATTLQGAEIDGVEVLELNGDGKIQDVWRIDTRINLPGTPTPAASGGG